MEICILSGPIGSGKTTRLQHWVKRQPSVRGILSPVEEGKRRFRHVPGESWCEMEAGPGEQDVVATPRYRLSAAASKASGGVHGPGRVAARPAFLFFVCLISRVKVVFMKLNAIVMSGT